MNHYDYDDYKEDQKLAQIDREMRISSLTFNGAATFLVVLVVSYFKYRFEAAVIGIFTFVMASLIFPPSLECAHILGNILCPRNRLVRALGDPDNSLHDEYRTVLAMAAAIAFSLIVMLRDWGA